MQPHRRQPARPPVPGILQARILVWVAISSSNAWKWKVKVKSLSRVWLLAIPWTAAYQAPPSMGFSRQEYWSGVPSSSPVWGPDVVKLMLPSSSWTFGCRTLRPIKELAFWILFGHWGARESGWKENFSGKMTEPLRFSVSSFLSPSLPFFLLKILLYLTALVLVVAHRIFYLHHVRSSSLTRDWTQAPCIGSTES